MANIIRGDIKMYKKAQGALVAVAVIVVGILIAAVLLGGGGALAGMFALDGQDDKDGIDMDKSCDGISSVNYLYNDKDFYKITTDPGTNITFYDPLLKTVEDDATSTTVPIKENLKGLAGNTEGVPDGSYFAEEAEVVSACVDIQGEQSQIKLKKAGAPTLTVVGDDGITKLTTSQNETVAASSSYDAYVTVKSPSDECASNHGALIAINYDATYLTDVDSNLAGSSLGVLEPHTNVRGAGDDTNTNDQYQVFLYPGELCDGDKDEVKITYTTASTVSNGGTSMEFKWFPLNKDLDADTGQVITGIYDEDNNIITLGNKSVSIYTSD